MTLDDLMDATGIDTCPGAQALERIARLIDHAGDVKRDDGIALALNWCEALEKRGLTNSELAVLEYFRANAWATRQPDRQDLPAVWAWEQPASQKQLFHLRKAVNHSGFDQLSVLRQCQILTNLANVLNTVGRFVDALEYWDKALNLAPHFGMALGNRGYALETYGRALYDGGHTAVFLHIAHDSLNAALSKEAQYNDPGYKAAKAFFKVAKNRIERLHIDLSATELDGHELGKTDEERRYRRWVLHERLFLNPLNDLGVYSIASRDIFGLPDFVTSIHEPPTLIGFFNQMKQEFVSARWLYFEGVTANAPHFSDRDVGLLNTLDYPSYSLAVEKIKAAFGIAYSLFDKIGFFINDYMHLKEKPTNVYFKKIWYKNFDKREIRPEFSQSENWPFRGLFWLSKDLFDEELRDVTEPDAHALYDIRNHQQHKYLKVHEILIPHNQDDTTAAWWQDRLAYSIQREDFEAKTLRLLKLARAALIYLSLGMHREEKRRSEGKNKDRIAPMSLDIWDDEWKR